MTDIEVCIITPEEAKAIRAEIKRLRAVITRAKDALLDGQSTQWVHDLLADALCRTLEPKAMTAVDEMDRADGIIECTPQAVGELVAETKRLRALLQKLKWKSIDKDNMEYSCRIPYNVMDEIRAALEPKS